MRDIFSVNDAKCGSGLYEDKYKPSNMKLAATQSIIDRRQNSPDCAP